MEHTKVILRVFPLVLFVLQLLLPLFVPLYAILNICADFCVFSSSSSHIYFAMCFFLLLHLFCLIPKTKSHVKHEFCFSIFTFVLIQKQIQMFVLCFVACNHFFFDLCLLLLLLLSLSNLSSKIDEFFFCTPNRIQMNCIINKTKRMKIFRNWVR